MSDYIIPHPFLLGLNNTLWPYRGELQGLSLSLLDSL